MAKKKNKDEGELPQGSPLPTEDLTGAFATDEATGAYATEGFGAGSDMSGDHGVPTEDFSGAHGIPTEGLGGPPGSGGIRRAPARNSGEHRVVPTESFGGGAARPGRSELDELDDVLVLLPEEDEAPRPFSGQVIRSTGMGDQTIRATSGHVLSGESPTGIEDVRLLVQHPDHGVVPVDEFPDAQYDDLPDIEDVEDITSLVDQAVTGDLPPPRRDFEEQYSHRAFATKRSRGGFGVFLRVAAAAALLVTGVLYGPELYDRYVAEGTALANGDGNGTGGGTTTGGGSTGVDTIPSGDPARVRFRTWVDGVLASHLGTDVPSER
jgi:hypothetical protein